MNRTFQLYYERREIFSSKVDRNNQFLILIYISIFSPSTLSFVSDRYISVPITSIISRLTQRNHHLLSIKLSEFLNLKPDSILKHWAKSKISRMKSMTPNSVVIGSSESNEIEDQVSESIIKKFAQQPSANYSSVAKVAFKAGRIRLATKVSSRKEVLGL